MLSSVAVCYWCYPDPLEIQHPWTPTCLSNPTSQNHAHITDKSRWAYRVCPYHSRKIICIPVLFTIHNWDLHLPITQRTKNRKWTWEWHGFCLTPNRPETNFWTILVWKVLMGDVDPIFLEPWAYRVYFIFKFWIMTAILVQRIVVQLVH